jgi:hypothetical protein
MVIAHLKKSREAYIKLIELVVLIAGVYFGLTGLKQNTESNLTASRSQLYEAEAVISGREYDAADSSLQSLYAHPDEAITDPREYCLARMRAMSRDEAVLQARNVEELYEAFGGLKSYENEKPTPGIVETRRAFIHLTSLFGIMHSALDYQNAGVMSAGELTGWLGYVTDIGPHPLLLATFWSWHESRYMSREFAEKVRAKLLEGSPRHRRVIEYYYPQMLAPQFLDGLAEYR